MWPGVDESYKGPLADSMEAIMDPRFQSRTRNTEKLKGHTINFIPIDGLIDSSMDGA